MSEYRVNLDIFAGPLDLLLYLVRRDEVDIYDIPIARITEAYVQHVEVLTMLDIDVAGDFLVMAATLMEIKSMMLLPRAETEAEGPEDPTDPRMELVRQLLEYKKFKDAANLLESSAECRSQRFTRPDSIIAGLKSDAEPELDIDQVSIWTLLEAFDEIMKATGRLHSYDHIKDDTPIDLYQIEILHRLQEEGPMMLQQVFADRGSRLVMVGLFLAMLELIRNQLIWAEQPQQCGPIYLRPLTDEPAEEAVQRAIYAAAEDGIADEEPAEAEYQDASERREGDEEDEDEDDDGGDAYSDELDELMDFELPACMRELPDAEHAADAAPHPDEIEDTPESDENTAGGRSPSPPSAAIPIREIPSAAPVHGDRRAASSASAAGIDPPAGDDPAQCASLPE
ncbi:MAG: segregation/condensation protein A [Phycisphaerae bacterium]|nr:segregation/condensation protein A [Phycisphaerae bacterium]